MRDVQCYELFGGIALKNHAFSYSSCGIVSQLMMIYGLTNGIILLKEAWQPCQIDAV